MAVASPSPTPADRHAAWRPEVLDLSRAADRDRFDGLLDGRETFAVHDTLADQLDELIQARHPQRKLDAAELAEVRTGVLGPTPDRFGRWVFFPWSGALVRLLPPDDFRFLRSVRNQYKITADEQALLATKTVGVVGLSVGLAAAVTLALEGVGGRFRLADFDTLGLSNLNRLRARVCDLGVNKAVLAARQLFEIDPYLEVEIFPQGIREESLAAFFGDAVRLDLLVEECDDLWAKVRLREEASRRRVPVVMDTSDRGMIDVERYDLDPAHPPFHGLAGEVRSEDLAGLSKVEKIPFILRILDVERLSVGASASLPELGKTLETWPQLASSVTLGGALVTDVARRIFLGDFTESGRYFVDPADTIRDGKAESLRPASDHPACPAEPDLDVPPRGIGPATEAEIRYLVWHATMAPSGGNCQPWRFEWRAEQLFGYIVPERTQPLLDYRYRGSYVALGAAAENVVLTAAELGLSVSLQVTPELTDSRLAWVMQFKRGGQPDSLFHQVRRRATNRKVGPRVPLTEADRSALARAVTERGGALYLLADDRQLENVARLMGRCDRCLLMTPQGHADTFGELRFNPGDVQRTRDGLDVDLLDVSPTERALLQVLARWPVMARLRQIGGGSALEALATTAVAGSSAVGLVRVSDSDPASLIAGGRAVQRMWLTATELGLSLHPWTALPYLLARCAASDWADLSAEQVGWFEDLHAEYHRLLTFPPGVDILLFRLGHADAVAKRSLRRSVNEVLTITP